MIRKRKSDKKHIGVRALALAGVLSLSLFATPIDTMAKAAEEEMPNETVNISRAAEANAVDTGERSISRLSYNLPGIPSRYISSYTQKNIAYNGTTLNKRAAVINGITYVPIKLFSETVAGARVTYNSSARTTTVSASGLYLTATDGGYVIWANDRPLFSFSPSIVMSNGDMYVPSSALERAYGIKRSSETSRTVSYSGAFSPLVSASRFYREDEVYWLSKIISAESSGESLLGQIAVGDVILNRVKSAQFPNTIYSVIFDKKYGVQFSPTADGRIYAAPTYTATLAAKICLEGTSLSDDAMYFLNPRAAESNWIVKNRKYIYTIGNHDFYK